MKKNVKGITLVALVITIIILLILAGITISQLSGSGLFENAKIAEQRSKEGQEQEEAVLKEYEQQIESNRDTITIDKEEYEQLKKDAKTLIVTGTTNSSSDWKKVAEYPEGYNKDTVYIKNFYVELNGNIVSDYEAVSIYLGDDGIYFAMSDHTRYDRPVTILLGVK